MKIIVETPRLILRQFVPDDYYDVFDLNNDPEVMKYVSGKSFDSLAAAKNFMDHYGEYEKYGMGRWAVILKSTYEFTGYCGLKFQAELGVDGEVNLGYRFFKKFWGQKIATESSLASIDYGFEQLNLKQLGE
ncbi:MAG: GNAT family N-acetyltransferase [Chitinophagales bacterium]|nr:GNAT family N-acetyltransferase [Chitinophagales bacterium]